jgi:hypothetical protein
MIYTFKIRLNEDTLDREIKNIKVNDILVVVQGINTLKYQVIQLLTNQILTKKLDNNKSDTTTATFTINSYYEGKLYLEYSNNKGKRKVTFTNIKSFELFRNGNKVADIDEISQETIKKQEDEKQEAREKRLIQKKETNKETAQEFVKILNSLEVGDDLIISTGEVDEDEEIKKENITDISLKLSNKSDKFIFDFIYSKADGIDSSNYDVLKDVDNIILNKKSIRTATNGATFILSVINNKTKNNFNINNIFNIKRQKSVLKSTKSKKLNNIDIEAIKNNPRLRDALLKNPSLLSKFLGDKQRGVIPFESRNEKQGREKKQGLTGKFKKGNKVLFTYIGNTIKGQIVLIRNTQYIGLMIKDDEIRITTRSGSESIIFKIKSFTKNDDEYNCDITVRTIKNGSAIDTEYKAMIQIDDYNN